MNGLMSESAPTGTGKQGMASRGQSINLGRSRPYGNKSNRSCGRRTAIANDPTEVTVASFDQPRRTRRFRPEGLGPELLENREVMAYSAMGFSLPDLAVGNNASPVASWGQPFAVQIQAYNRGASSLPELPQYPLPPSMADAVTEVDVYLARGRNRVQIDTIDLGRIRQNSLSNGVVNIDLPDTPPDGFPAAGGQFRMVFVPRVSNQIRLPMASPNGGSWSMPINVLPSLPQLQFVSDNSPGVIVPGQVFTPQVVIANVGGANIATQGPLTVALVASADPYFSPDDIVLDQFTFESLPGLNQRPIAGGMRGLHGSRQGNLPLAANEASAFGAKITFPLNGPYYIGYVIDPDRTITQISDNAGVDRSARLNGLKYVDSVHGFTQPGNVTNADAEQFPNFPYQPPAATVIRPNALSNSPLYYYPPYRPYGGIITKPRGWV